MDRRRILNRNRLCKEYRDGVQSFIDIALHLVNERNEILCPCRICHNKSFHSVGVVHVHLLKSGMDMSYNKWIYHGEHIDHFQDVFSTYPNNQQENVSNANMFDMIDDAFHRIENDDQEKVMDKDRPDEINETMGGNSSNLDRGDADSYEKLLHEAQVELYPGRTDYTRLTYIVELSHNKVVMVQISDNIFLCRKSQKKNANNRNKQKYPHKGSSRPFIRHAKKAAKDDMKRMRDEHKEKLFVEAPVDTPLDSVHVPLEAELEIMSKALGRSIYGVGSFPRVETTKSFATSSMASKSELAEIQDQVKLLATNYKIMQEENEILKAQVKDLLTLQGKSSSDYGKPSNDDDPNYDELADHI